MRGAFLLLGICLLAASVPAAADEKILSWDSKIVVEKTGDPLVTETILVWAEGKNINRGHTSTLSSYGSRVPKHLNKFLAESLGEFFNPGGFVVPIALLGAPSISFLRGIPTFIRQHQLYSSLGAGFVGALPRRHARPHEHGGVDTWSTRASSQESDGLNLPQKKLIKICKLAV